MNQAPTFQQFWDVYGLKRDRIAAEISATGYPCMQGSCSEVYLEKAFDNTPWRPQQRLPHAVELGDTSLMFLTHPSITTEQMDAYLAAIETVLTQASAE